MNKKIILRILKIIDIEDRAIFSFISISVIFQFFIFIVFIYKYNINYLLNIQLQKYEKNKFHKNKTSDLEIKESNNIININTNPPIKNNKDIRKTFKDKENNLCIIKNCNESNSTVNFDNIELNINKYYLKCYESFKVDNVLITSNNKLDSSNNLGIIKTNSENKELDYNKKKIQKIKKTFLICNYLKKYVPFINIFILNDLNIYIIKLSLFLIWLNLYFFFTIINEYLIKIINKNFFEKPQKIIYYILYYSFIIILSIISLFLLQLLCFTHNDLHKFLNKKMDKSQIENKYKINFTIYFIIMFIFHIILICLVYKNYKNKNKGKDAITNYYLFFTFSFEIPSSVFIYLVIIPFCLFIYALIKKK